MITLAEVFESLSSAEFSQVQLGAFDPRETDSAPDPRQYSQLKHYLNSALRNIYTKFWLATDDVTLELDPTIEVYELQSIYAQSNVASPQPIKYIADSVDKPFTDNVLKIENIYNSEGERLPLLYSASMEYHWTPNYRSIHLPVPVPDDPGTLRVIYRASHPYVEINSSIEPEDVVLDLPPQFFDALCFYMASKFFGGSSIDGGTQDNSFYQKYLNQCMEIEQSGLFIQPDYEDWRFEQYGWV